MDKTSLISAPKILENFEPLKTPFHIVAIAAIVTIVLIPEYEIKESPWNILTTTISMVILLSIIFSLFKHPIENKKYKVQIKFARSTGIASAILCFIIAGEKALQFPEYFYKIYIPAIAQIITFGFYIFVIDRTSKNQRKDIEDSEINEQVEVNRPSYLQLALITTGLLIGIAKNANNGAEHYVEFTPTKNSFFAPTEEKLKSIANGLESVYRETTSEDDSIMEFRVDSLKRTFDFILSPKEIVSRYERVDKMLFRYWLLCIIIWMFFIVKNLRPDITFGDQVD